MKTRIVVPSVLVAVCLFSLTACHHGGKLAPKDLPIKCNVNPDEVMGAHYTSQDFQIHNVLDEYSTEWTSYLTWHNMLPADAVNGDNYDVVVLDTTLIAPYLDSLTRILGDAAADYFFSWTSVLYPTEPPYRFLAVSKKPLVDGSAVIESSAVISAYNAEPVLNFTFNDSTAKRWYQITNDNMGRTLAISLGSRVLSTPMVMMAIEGGKCSVSGLTEDETCALATILSSKN